MRGGLPGWLSFPFPPLVTQGTLQIVGEVIVKSHGKMWFRILFVVALLHGGLGGQWKCAFDPERSRAGRPGWPG